LVRERETKEWTRAGRRKRGIRKERKIEGGAVQVEQRVVVA
jgi:hypothetical protein